MDMFGEDLTGLLTQGQSRVDRSGHQQLTTIESRDTDTNSISGEDVTHDDTTDVYIMADADKRALHEYNELVEMYRENAKR
ncbi:hypothetical protein DPMN_113471 [Dreissena polymorpha]|uniref:Uncharacterized protein n=1 Tax=Dreissena polymorpha TaxID=45954 RepID=A0A9D4QQV4_DREPO|nr:hypothetical protein DPMN_113471 [Dreissena polymorpha]